MQRLDSVLAQYDLKTLEAAFRRRRKKEERELARMIDQKTRIETDLRRLKRQLDFAKSQGFVFQRKPNARRLNDITLAEALERVFRSRKNPIHYKDLTEAVEKRGLYKTKSKNLLSTVAVTLKRDRRFKKVSPGVYALRASA